MTESANDTRPSVRVCVIGGGPRFLSGISYYTRRLTIALAETHPTSAILVRQLLPTRFYPGGDRVGTPMTDFSFPADVDVYDGIDWFWGPSIFRAINRLRRNRPDVVVIQWWTGAVLHSYLLLAFVARRLGARVIIEFHEVQDVGEMDLPLVGTYVNLLMPLLVRMSDAAVVHSSVDVEPVVNRYRLGSRPVVVIPHGPYDQHRATPKSTETAPATDRPLSLLYFGVIRPFKGVEDLVRAFDQLTEEQATAFSLTIAGETWENWTLPGELIAASKYADRITFINRYLTDDELADTLSHADAVVLPYHRSSASGPLHTAMSNGLPVVVSAVGGLVEAAQDYDGAVFVPPKDPDAIKAAIIGLSATRGARFRDPHSWARTVDAFDELFGQLEVRSLGVDVRESA